MVYIDPRPKSRRPRPLSVAQMREADRRCIEDLGIPGAVLMNQAGVAIFEVLRELNPEGKPVGIVCGKGNNGGDGFVVARLALLAGWDTQVLLTAQPEEIRGDAATFLRVYQRLGGSLHAVTDQETALEQLERMATCHVLVDALLGTGVQGPARGLIGEIITAWPQVTTLSVDIPSGMNANTGCPEGPCIRATHTVTMQFQKQGFHLAGSEQYLGRLHVADIGIPQVCADDTAWAQLRARFG